MKTYLKGLLLIVLSGVVFVACSKDDNNDDDNNNPPVNYFGNNPAANAQSDSKATGIYKGVVIGSSGYLLINIQNEPNNKKVYAVLNFDNVYDSLLCTVLNSYSGGDINGALFTSALSTQNTISFSVKADGTNPVVQVNIPGHQAMATVNKEQSTSVVKVYTGIRCDTLIAGYFNYPCGSQTQVTPANAPVKKTVFNAILQNNVMTVLTHHFCDLQGEIITINVPSNTFSFNHDSGCPGTPQPHVVTVTITDGGFEGREVATPPYNTNGSCHDLYNGYFIAVRIK